MTCYKTYLYHNTLVGHIVKEEKNLASEARLSKLGAKRQIFASFPKISKHSRPCSELLMTQRRCLLSNYSLYIEISFQIKY